MIIKGNNESKKNPSELVKQDDKSDKSSKLVEVEILKANEEKVTFVKRNADPKKHFSIKYAIFYVIKKLAALLFLSIIFALFVWLFPINSTKELRVYIINIAEKFDILKYKTSKDLDDVIKEREYVHVSIIMQDDQILMVDNELESQLQVTRQIFV